MFSRLLYQNRTTVQNTVCRMYMFSNVCHVRRRLLNVYTSLLVFRQDVEKLTCDGNKTFSDLLYHNRTLSQTFIKGPSNKILTLRIDRCQGRQTRQHENLSYLVGSKCAILHSTSSRLSRQNQGILIHVVPCYRRHDTHLAMKPGILVYLVLRRSITTKHWETRQTLFITIVISGCVLPPSERSFFKIHEVHACCILRRSLYRWQFFAYPRWWLFASVFVRSLLLPST
jgi:hypothetical protein